MSRELEKSSITILILYMSANIINYVFQIIMGRMLSVTDFGSMNALFSVFMITALPSAVFSLVVSKYTAEFNVKNEAQKIPFFIKKMAFFAGIICIIVTVMFIIFSPVIGSFLKINIPGSIELLSLAIGLGLISPVISGALQGLKKFVNLGLFSVVATVIKLAFSVLFVYLGYSIFGILGALLISAVISIFYGVIILKKHFHGVKPESLGIDRKILVRFLIVSLITSSCLAIFTNIDMLLVKHFFPPTEAGLYGSAMQFGKILLYVPSAFVLAMFPIAAEENAKSGNSFSILKRTLLYCAILTIVGAVLFSSFSQFFVHLLFGDKYIAAAELILPSCLMIIPLGFNTTIMNYSLAVNKTTFLIYSMILGCVSGLVLIFFFFHGSIFEILYTLTIVGAAVFISNFIYLQLSNKKYKAAIK